MAALLAARKIQRNICHSIVVIGANGDIVTRWFSPAQVLY
jgi:hypothetical protein